MKMAHTGNQNILMVFLSIHFNLGYKCINNHMTKPQAQVLTRNFYGDQK